MRASTLSKQFLLQYRRNMSLVGTAHRLRLFQSTACLGLDQVSPLTIQTSTMGSNTFGVPHDQFGSQSFVDSQNEVGRSVMTRGSETGHRTECNLIL